MIRSALSLSSAVRNKSDNLMIGMGIFRIPIHECGDSMERVEKKVRAKLRLQGMRFAGHERLLILIALALFPLQAFQISISMARHNNGKVM
jgi:hypothetical protein